ncbi:S-4TM family putative pore-forming effector [Streptomyces massasporeus]|uniref:S-4TM family putative pore-forming effector n=1 Tax=Streptomyces massasporeus TaxID=67324 RepID=UPI0033BE29BC
MATGETEPIFSAQNTARARRLLAAQAQLYTDAKRVHDIRIMTVVSLALLTIIVAVAVPDIRVVVGATGGSIAFLWSIISSDREKRRRREASFIQEEFDTQVFGLPWNDFAADHPSPTLITEAATRYRGNRTKDWYPNTRNVDRPLDVLICQRSNLGWGASMHRFYAACLTGALILLVALGLTVTLVARLSTPQALTAVCVPLLGPAREIIEMIRSNRESSETKAKTESKVLSLWNQGVRGTLAVSIDDCRSVQDRILSIRQSNAHIPDWLDRLRRTKNESLMQQSADYLIDEAIRFGKVT